jgi:hypothetical protein
MEDAAGSMVPMREDPAADTLENELPPVDPATTVVSSVSKELSDRMRGEESKAKKASKKIDPKKDDPRKK